MPWVIKRTAEDRKLRFQAMYRDPSGRQRSAGTYSSRRAAEQAGRRAEARVEAGTWIDGPPAVSASGGTWRSSGGRVGTWS
jgi:hypothetical protein